MSASQKSMHYWKWQLEKGYITNAQLADCARHENEMFRLMSELPGSNPEGWKIPFPEFEHRKNRK